MYYEIIIAFNGKHLFATAPRSVQTNSGLKELFKVLNEKFPEKEGFSLSVSFNPEIMYGANRIAILEAILIGDGELYKLFDRR